jgi:hypothetical protein
VHLVVRLAMAELRALCAACRKPLAGPLVASSCNHVFHRKCLAAATTCGRCHQPQTLLPEEALQVFGLGFEEVDDADALAVIAAIAALDTSDEVNRPSHEGDLSDDDVVMASIGEGTSTSDLEALGRATPVQSQAVQPKIVDLDAFDGVPDELKDPNDIEIIEPRNEQELAQDQSKIKENGAEVPTVQTTDDSPSGSGRLTLDDDKFKEVARICVLRQRKRKLQHRIAELLEELNKSSEIAKQQQDKLRAVERAKNKQETECTKLATDIRQYQERKEKLTELLTIVRQRDAVLEYWEELRSKSADDALAYLLRSVSCVPNPWKILTEVARLRDHHRARLAEWEKDRGQASLRAARARRELEKQIKSVSELQGKVQSQRRTLQRQLSRADSDPGSSREAMGFFSPGQKRARINDLF